MELIIDDYVSFELKAVVLFTTVAKAVTSRKLIVCVLGHSEE